MSERGDFPLQESPRRDPFGGTPDPAGRFQRPEFKIQNSDLRIRYWAAHNAKRPTKCGPFLLSERGDLNPGPPEPHSGALPGCATLRNTSKYADTPSKAIWPE